MEYTNKIECNFKFEVELKEHDDGKFSCFIPCIDTYFSAKNKEGIEKKSNTMLKIWINHFNEKNSNKES